MKIDPAELRAGLAETRRFVLSHHLPSEYDRCYSPRIGGRPVHICARCLGVYPGIAAGFLAALFLPNDPSVAIVAFLPLPALFDWALTTFRPARGSNVVRTATGALLGCGYGLGVSLLLLERELAVVAIGAVYAVVAGFLLARAR
ncbi:DUF2085 domain-containing protein [Halopiger xanaduensis]|uniref:DUF2085 domain-containing protein n=1 Tax=Halopiger xanaduensis (strain DSM 18323 / JCM 14033 / SH-6) TaxID=797210 RepID=F8D8N0_HALXS|nr:DUF2085 domain-containing protein [Halopiger xanaduensis]AEH36782.1 hypothetical protein Halxa_2157 [Halopiger xanaduensis SH-6]